MARKILLTCGILSSLLYVVLNILGAVAWRGYSSASQTVSELFAIGAPSRPLVIALMVAYDVLLYAFGLGVWKSASQKRVLRIAAAGIVGKEVLGLVVTLFFPLHQRGVEGTSSDAIHAILTGLGVLCMLAAMVFAATVLGKQFRLYTFATILILVVFATFGFLDGPRMAANLPTPWLGVTERISIFAYMLWIAVLAIVLWRRGPELAQSGTDLEQMGSVAPRPV